MTESAAHLHERFSSRLLRDALGAFATGVTVVTTLDAHGHPAGLTVNSFASVSLCPPLVLWSLVHSASTREAFMSCTHFGVSVLAADQLPLAQRFATHGLDRFRQLDIVKGTSGVPLLPGALAWFECRREVEHIAGDHTIFIGRVERLGLMDTGVHEPGRRPCVGTPLLYHHGVLHDKGLA